MQMSDDPDNDLGTSIPYTHLSSAALRGVIESFVLREGTEYGEAEVVLEEKVAAVMRQLQSGEAQIVYDPATSSVDIIPARNAGPG